MSSAMQTNSAMSNYEIQNPNIKGEMGNKNVEEG
jgi:hypothetical protein